ncbi:MAG: hypothetical protein ACQET5_04640 [Halobacteriota archaeon]
MNRPTVVLFFILVGCLVGSAPVAGPAAATDGAVELENALSRSTTEGAIDVETRLSIPSSTAELEITLPEGVELLETDGFRRVGDRTYEWTQATRTPSVTYEYEGTVYGSRGDREGHFFVAANEWALVRTPGIDVSWRGTGSELDRTNTVDGEGVASTHMAYLGPYDEYTGAAAGQEFRLVVPESAELREDPEEIVAALETAAERLSIGEPTDEVLVVAAPTAEHAWAPAGLQRGNGGDIWVRDDERLGTDRDTWVHEYVHTRQRYRTTDKTRWTIEGIADYYAALLPYEAGDISYERFRNKLEEGADNEYEDIRLVEPETWAGTDADYERGALVFAYLDGRLRADAETTLDAVAARVNDPDSELTQRRFLDAIESAGGDEMGADVERYTETTAVPPVATQRERVDAFGGPDIRYAIESITISGPYRTASVDDPRLVVDETLEVAVVAENVGDDAGSFEAEFRSDGDLVASETGRLEPDESTTLRFSNAFDSPGEYEIAAGTERLTVPVEEPSDIEVAGLEAEPTTVAPGDPITVRATVASAADRPGAGEVVFEADGGPVATESVRVGEGTATVETTIEFDEPGTYTVSAGGRTATVTVEASEPTVPDPAVIDDQSGFGPAVAVVALSFAATLGVRRR